MAILIPGASAELIARYNEHTRGMSDEDAIAALLDAAENVVRLPKDHRNSDEGIALDIAEQFHHRRAVGGDRCDADALERLARWANAHGYLDATDEEHAALERGE